jgi:HEPN domain-containing protein
MATQHRHPKAYFAAAKGYQAAADRLMQAMDAGEGLRVRDPTYFLYAHAVELALKACLLACGFNPPASGKKGHTIEKLYAECSSHKLLGMDDADRGMIKLIHHLGTGNECHEYRYPDRPKVPRVSPDLPWTREVVGRLMAEVEPHVGAWVAANPVGPATKIDLDLGNIILSRQAVPTTT